MSIQHISNDATLESVLKIASIVVVTQASGCRAQTPCSVQPSLMVVDENVLKLSKYFLFLVNSFFM